MDATTAHAEETTRWCGGANLLDVMRAACELAEWRKSVSFNLQVASGSSICRICLLTRTLPGSFSCRVCCRTMHGTHGTRMAHGSKFGSSVAASCLHARIVELNGTHANNRKQWWLHNCRVFRPVCPLGSGALGSTCSIALQTHHTYRVAVRVIWWCCCCCIVASAGATPGSGRSGHSGAAAEYRALSMISIST